MFLYKVLSTLLDIYVLIVIIRAVISWFSPDPYNPLYRLLVDLTEPVLSKIRQFMMRHLPLGGIDLSPIVLILLINWLVKGIILELLFKAGG